jgi:hypothetical protein
MNSEKRSAQLSSSTFKLGNILCPPHYLSRDSHLYILVSGSRRTRTYQLSSSSTFQLGSILCPPRYLSRDSHLQILISSLNVDSIAKGEQNP